MSSKIDKEKNRPKPQEGVVSDNLETIFTEGISQISIGPNVVKLLLTQDQGPRQQLKYTHNVIIPTSQFLEFISHTLELLKKNENFIDHLDSQHEKTSNSLNKILSKIKPS